MREHINIPVSAASLIRAKGNGHECLRGHKLLRWACAIHGEVCHLFVGVLTPGLHLVPLCLTKLPEVSLMRSAMTPLAGCRGAPNDVRWVYD